MHQVRHVGFIRNVMVGREGLTREVLLNLAVVAGGSEPVSHLVTGNLAFDLAPGRASAWAAEMEARIAKVIGRKEQVFVRSVEYLARMVASDPFSAAPFAHPHERAVSFLPPGVAIGTLLPLRSKRGDLVVFAATATEAFTVTRMVNGRVTGGGSLIEAASGCRITTRAWRTVEHIVRKSAGHR